MGFIIENGVLTRYEEEPGVREVVIPENVRKIGDKAFLGCSELTSVTIPGSITEIGKNAFWYCTGLTSVTIPDSVTKIGEWAFWGCVGLRSVTIPDNVTKIGDAAFFGCMGLTSVKIPDSVTEIGKSAFHGCTGLTSVTIPDSVTKIGKAAFDGCGHVIRKGFTLVDDSEGYVSLDEMLSMLQKKDYAVHMKSCSGKYQNLWLQFCANPDEEELLTYIGENFTEMFQFAIEQNNADAVEAVCKQGKLLNAENIDDFIIYASEEGRFVIQVMLMHYKNEHIGYATNKFEL